jgi:hypothetical protein
MEWQPIETAPKDGTPLLLFIDGESELADRMTTGRWNSGRWELCQVGGYAEDSEVWTDPTAWMPLPPPPEGKI